MNQGAKKVPWPDLESASTISNWANIFFILSLVVGLLSSTVIVMISSVKEAHWDIERRNSKERIAELNARAELLKKDAQFARLETERIKEIVRWRSLSKAQSEIFTSSVLGKPGAVYMMYVEGDPEALFFATQFKNILSSAHWTAQISTMRTSSLITEIIVLDDEFGNAATLRNALKSAGIPFATKLPSQQPTGVTEGSLMVSGLRARTHNQ